jgi:hypothetical protein
LFVLQLATTPSPPSSPMPKHLGCEIRWWKSCSDQTWHFSQSLKGKWEMKWPKESTTIHEYPH